MIRDLTLDGGVRLLVETTAAAEVAAVGVWYDRGSRDEGHGEGGATHVVEHMLFKGTVDLSASDLARRFDALGGAANAFTEREVMGLHAVVPVEAFAKAARLLCALVNGAAFEGEEFCRELSVISNELEAAEDDPEEAAADAYSKRLWGEHGMGKKIGGEKSEVQALRRDLIYDFYLRRFKGSPALITVSGGIDADRAFSLFNRAGFSLAAEGVLPTRLPPPQPAVRGQVFQVFPAQYVQVFCGVQRFGRITDGSYYALETANAAFGDSMGSRLFQKLRERLGLCYSVYSAPTLFHDFSLWSAYATCAAEDAPRLMRALYEEIRSAADEGFMEEEIVCAKAHLRGMIKIAAQDAEYRMRRLARQALYGSPIMSVAESIAAIAAVTADQASAALADFLSQPPIIFAAGNRRAKAGFSRELSALWSNL